MRAPVGFAHYMWAHVGGQRELAATCTGYIMTFSCCFKHRGELPITGLDFIFVQLLGKGL